MNRKAEIGNGLFLFYFIFILLMITGAVVIGSALSFGKEFDMRMQDSEILSSKIINCLENQEGLSETQITNLFTTCNFDESVFEKGLIVSIGSQEKVFFKYGDVVVCGLQDKNPSYPKCTSHFLNVKIDGKDTELYVIAGSNLKAESKNE